MFRTSFYYICIIACFANYGSYFVLGTTKRFKVNASIYEPSNWINDGEDCSGVIFPDTSEGPIVIDILVTQELVLPINSHYITILDGGYIEFSNDSKIFNRYGPLKDEHGSAMSCIKVKSLDYSIWFEANNWEFDGNDNLAIPDSDRFPCQGDDVIIPFPSNIFASGEIRTDTYFYITDAYELRSLRYGDLQFTNESFQNYIKSDLGAVLFMSWSVQPLFINASIKCTTPQEGCICSIFYEHCNFDLLLTSNTDCDNPISPLGFCEDICGASITFEIRNGFSIKRINDILDDYTDVYTYARKSWYNGNEIIQIILREKDFSGLSTDYGITIYNQLHNDASTLKIKRDTISITVSGEVKLRRSIFGAAITMVVCTLIGVGTIFGLLFYLYGAEDRSYVIRNGLSFLSPRPFSTLHPSFMARFINKDDESGLIFEGQSLGGSVLSLDKSFENPLFGSNPEASTSTSFKDAEVKITTDKERRSISLENPLYDIKNSKEGDSSEEIVETEE